MKQCTVCTKAKALSEFYSVSNKPGIPRSECRACTNSYNSKRQKENKKARNAYKAAWCKSHPESHKKWIEANRDKVNTYSRKHRKANLGKRAAYLAKYRADKDKRTPKWLTKSDWLEIKWAYEIAAQKTRETGIQYSVDHILPLRGKTVSGLHCPNNLQIITLSENSRKSWKYEY